jgi:hypothetical protein
LSVVFFTRAPVSGWRSRTAGLKIDTFSTSIASVTIGIMAERCRGSETLRTVYWNNSPSRPADAAERTDAIGSIGPAGSSFAKPPSSSDSSSLPPLSNRPAPPPPPPPPRPPRLMPSSPSLDSRLKSGASVKSRTPSSEIRRRLANSARSAAVIPPS